MVLVKLLKDIVVNHFREKLPQKGCDAESKSVKNLIFAWIALVAWEGWRYQFEFYTISNKFMCIKNPNFFFAADERRFGWIQ